MSVTNSGQGAMESVHATKTEWMALIDLENPDAKERRWKMNALDVWYCDQKQQNALINALTTLATNLKLLADATAANA